MDSAKARLYFAAALANPILAAYVSVLDQHGMHHLTDIAPYDWEEAFEALFNLGFIATHEFNATDFKRAFRQTTPPASEVEAALSALASLRQKAIHEENSMGKFDLFENPDAALALSSRARAQPLAGRDAFEPLAPRTPSPNELIARPVKPSAELAPMGETRRALDVPPSTSSMLDARAYTDEFDMKLYCCGRELKLEYADGGHDVTQQFPGAAHKNLMVEYIWHSVCQHCQGEHEHSITRPLPADYRPR